MSAGDGDDDDGTHDDAGDADGDAGSGDGDGGSNAGNGDGDGDAGHNENGGGTVEPGDPSTEGTGIDGDDDNPDVPATGGDDCSEEYLVEGDFCEETCSDPSSVIGKAAGIQKGTCDENFCKPAYKKCIIKVAMKQAVFVKAESPIPAAPVVFRTKDDCNPHVTV